MPKRSHEGHLLVSPGLKDAPVLDLMCSHFVLSLAAQEPGRFNVRRDLNGLLLLAGRHLVWPSAVLARLREFLSRRCRDNEWWSGHEALDHRAFLERHGVWRGPYEEGSLFFYLDEYAKDQARDLMAVLSATGQWLSHAVKKQATLVEKNIDALAHLLQLNRAERALLLYGTLARYQRELRSLLVDFKVNNAPEAYAALADIAGVPANEIGEALRAGSRLERIGLVENLISEHSITDLADLMKVSDRLPAVLMREYADQRELMAVFTRPSAPPERVAEDFSFAQDDLAMLRTLLGRAAQQREPGVNVLIYGPPGTGKTQLAKVAAQAAGLALYEVEYADRDGHSLSGRDRYRSLQIAQAFLKASAGAALLFDEVEDVFPPISNEAAQLLARAEQLPNAGNGSVSGKAWVNQILESNPVPTVWITNRIEQIDPAFRRRFAYHLELKAPPPGAREGLVRRALEGLAVGEELVARLVERQSLTPAQIHTAVRFARLAGEADQLETLIERQLRHADLALGQTPVAADAPRDHATRYDLRWLHLESRHPVDRIVQALAARGHGSLCFYGPPGTGKTALAEHIAQALGRPLMIRRASDLFSKFVGETEQNLAAMFRDAKAEGAVLLLDEADSFLQDRRGAQRNYEVSEVNEMLQGMERFAGVFICTTNLMDRLDQAALRRFAFKLQFRPLRPEQREAFFVAEVLGGQADALDAALRLRLARLEHLCVGDFAAVQTQARILGESLEPAAFLEQLEAEHRIKPEVREARPVGFVQ